MMMQRILIFGTGLLCLEACATSDKPSGEVVELRRQVLELQKVEGRHASQIEEINNKILVLSDRIDGSKNLSATPTAPAASAPTVAAMPSSEQQEGGAERLFAQAINDAKKNQVASLQKDVDMMFKGYKDSPLTNNALFLLGETFYNRKDYDRAAEQFEKLYKNFPDGNKAVSALYQLGLCFQKMGKTQEAKEAFENVMNIYPGSREAQEAQKQLSPVGGEL